MKCKCGHPYKHHHQGLLTMCNVLECKCLNFQTQDASTRKDEGVVNPKIARTHPDIMTQIIESEKNIKAGKTKELIIPDKYILPKKNQHKKEVKK